MCVDCADISFLPIPSRCYRCRKATAGFRVCESCRSSSFIRRMQVVCELSGCARQLVFSLKFGRARRVGKEISEHITGSFPRPEGYIIVPVPTATSRSRQRGYDQSVLIAKELSRIWGLPLVQVLSRTTQSRQVGTKRETRIAQLKEAYRIRNDRSLRGAKVLLVDDVVTTGATLESAAMILRRAGAKSIDAIVFAQK